MNASYQDHYARQRDSGLKSLALKPPNESVSAVEAWALASSLSRDQDQIRVWWPKLVGRPAERVREVSREIRAARPEMRQEIITRFGKRYPAIPNERGKVPMEELMAA